MQCLNIRKHSMIHRDIKIENIMLNSAFDAKVVDFGLARIDECFTGKDFVSTSLTKGIGTLAYMSPEMASEEEYSKRPTFTHSEFSFITSSSENGLTTA